MRLRHGVRTSSAVTQSASPTCRCRSVNASCSARPTPPRCRMLVSIVARQRCRRGEVAPAPRGSDRERCRHEQPDAAEQRDEHGVRNHRVEVGARRPERAAVQRKCGAEQRRSERRRQQQRRGDVLGAKRARERGGHAYRSYDTTRAAASACGTLIANSCGGAYWHA